MKKIAIFTSYYPPHIGGIERYVFNLAKEMSKQDIEVLIITTKYEKNLKTIEDLGYAKVYRLPTYSLFSNRYPIIKMNKEYFKLLKEIEQEKIDSIILNARFYLISLIGAKFARKQKIPACLIEHGSAHLTVHNKFLDALGHIYEHLLTYKIKKLVKDYYGVSLKCNQWLSHFKIQAKGVFYNSIDESEYELYKTLNSENYRKKITISYVGRIIKEKGVLETIQAYEKLNDKNNTQLVIAGDGFLLKKLKDRYESEDIVFTGKLNHDDVMRLLDKTDILVYPSWYAEGMPTSILEAGLMKCAVVATPAGGTKEIINNKELGFICEPTIESVKSGIEYYLENEEERKQAAEGLHSRVKERFIWSVTSKQILKELTYK